jgi:hypothetical protein
MSLQLHTEAAQRLQTKLDKVKSLLTTTATQLAEIEEQDVISAKHIDGAMETLLPPSRRQQWRNRSGFLAGIILGFALPEVFRVFQTLHSILQENNPSSDIFGLATLLLLIVLGSLMALYAYT